MLRVYFLGESVDVVMGNKSSDGLFEILLLLLILCPSLVGEQARRYQQAIATHAEVTVSARITGINTFGLAC